MAIGLVYDNNCSGELESCFAFWREITAFSIILIMKMRNKELQMNTFVETEIKKNH